MIDLVHFKGHYNPMHYIDSDEDAVKLAYAIVNNTKPKDAPASGGDKFWDDASVLLISALILYLIYEAPVYEQNFSTLMYMIQNCQMEEGDMEPNPLEMLFNELQERDPLHPAVLQFNSFKLGSTKTLQSVLITASANLYMQPVYVQHRAICRNDQHRHHVPAASGAGKACDFLCHPGQRQNL